MKKKNYEYALHFEVERERKSATDGTVKVYCNGELIAELQDEIIEISPGASYYGQIIDEYAPTEPEAYYILRAMFFSEAAGPFAVNEKLQAILDQAIADQEAGADEWPEPEPLRSRRAGF